MDTLLNRFSLLALLVASSFCSFAQDRDTSHCVNSCCCTTDLSPAGVMISHVHTKNEWMVSYRFMDMGMSGLGSRAHGVPLEQVFERYLMAPEEMNMQMHMLMGMYGITDRFTTMVMLNYQLMTMDMSMYAMNHVHGSMSSPANNMKSSGLGDIKIHALYGFVEKSTWQLVGSLGLSIPTGNIHKRGDYTDPMYTSKRYPYDMQPGSGSLDLLPGMSYLYQKNQLAFGTTVSAIYRSYRNSQGYRLGNEANLNSWFAYQWISWVSSSIRVEGNVAGQIDGRNPGFYAYNMTSQNTENYGGSRINAYLGSSLHFKGALKNNRLGVEYGLPLYQNLNGIQLKQQFAWHACWSFTF